MVISLSVYSLTDWSTPTLL